MAARYQVEKTRFGWKTNPNLLATHSHMRLEKAEKHVNDSRILHMFPRAAILPKIDCNTNQSNRSLLSEGLKGNSSKKQDSNKNPQITHNLLYLLLLFGTFSRTCSCFHPSFWLASPSIYSTHRHPDAWNGYWRTRGVAPSLTDSVFLQLFVSSIWKSKTMIKWGYVVLLLKTIGFFVEDDFSWLIDSLIVSLLETGSHSLVDNPCKKRATLLPQTIPEPREATCGASDNSGYTGRKRGIDLKHWEKDGDLFHPRAMPLDSLKKVVKVQYSFEWGSDEGGPCCSGWENTIRVRQVRVIRLQMTFGAPMF